MTPTRDLSQLEQLLGVKFQDRSLLETALTHRSYLNENKRVKLSNERLEFLGDAVLEFIVSDFIYRRFTNQPEGNLTTLRSSLVKTQTLSGLSQRLGLWRWLKLSRGEDKSGGRHNQNILADLFEAVVGAIYLDQGIDTAYDFVKRHLLADLTQTKIDFERIKGYKNSLQELVQSRLHITPEYRVIKEDQVNEARRFKVGVYVGDRLLGQGVGRNKKRAQEQAAKQALAYLKANGFEKLSRSGT